MARQSSRPKTRKQRRKRVAPEQRRSATAIAGEAGAHAGSARLKSARSAGDPLLGTVGERPRGLFGGVPVSEVAILGGIVALIFGLIDHGGTAMDLGAVLCGLGVTEVVAREHFSGFRSHTLLLSLIPAIAVEAVIALEVGVPGHRILLLVPVIPVFGVCFLLLRRYFRRARHARLVRYP